MIKICALRNSSQCLNSSMLSKAWELIHMRSIKSMNNPISIWLYRNRINSKIVCTGFNAIQIKQKQKLSSEYLCQLCECIICIAATVLLNFYLIGCWNKFAHKMSQTYAILSDAKFKLKFLWFTKQIHKPRRLFWCDRFVWLRENIIKSILLVRVLVP